jgi:hypothetical protein
VSFAPDPKITVLADDQDSMIYGRLFHITSEPTDLHSLCGKPVSGPQVLSPEGPVCRKCVMALVARYGR